MGVIDGRMAAAVVVLTDDGSGTAPTEPTSFDRVFACKVGGYLAREFRRTSDGACFVLQRIAAGGTPKRWLIIAWTEATSRDAALSAFQDLTSDLGANVVKAWRVVQAANGQLQIPTLDSDATAIGTAAKAVWPAAWTADGAGAAPRFIGDVLA